MALITADRVREFTSTNGTGTLTLTGAAVGYQTFFSAIGNGNTCYYAIYNPGVNEWEVGIGTVGAGTLARTTVLKSSNSNTLVDFTAGTKDVFVTYPAEYAVFQGGAFSGTTVTGTQVNITGQGDLRLEDTTGGEYVALQAPTSLASSYTLTLPIDDGTNGQALITDGSGNLSWSTAASGDVYGPASATSTAVALFDGTTGKLIKNSGVTIDGSNNVSGVAQLNATTVDLTNLEVTNIKAKDGTQAIALADSTGVATLSANPILNAGTANGVVYANGSKVLTMGSALTFDGTNLGVGINPVSYLSKLATNGNLSLGQGGKLQLWDATDSSGMSIYNANNSSIWFGTQGGSELMRLTSTGLGIGTSSPSFRLTVSESGSFDAEAGFINGNGTVRAGARGNTGNAFFGSFTSGKSIEFWSAGSLNATLDSSGNLGLGVTPSAWNSSYKAMQVNGSTLWSSGSNALLSANAYYDTGGTYRYINSAAATNYVQVTGQHQWYTAPSGTAGNAISFTQAMTLNGGGQLMINTTSASIAYLTINTSAAFGIDVYRSDASAQYSGIRFRDTTNATTYGQLGWDNGGLRLDGVAGTMYFSTSNTERMRIDSSGDLLVGKTSSSFSSNGLVVSSSGSIITTIASSNTYHVYSSSSTSFRFYVNENGGIYNYQANNTNLSDERTKTNIELCGNYLDKICSIPVKLFNYKDEAEGTQRTLGVIAQDVEKVAPEFVCNDGWLGKEPDTDGPLKTLYQTDMMFGLMKAIQELKAELDATKAEVAALKGV